MAKRPNLDLLLSELNIHVAILSEMWYKPSSKVNFLKYDVIRHDRADGYGGVAILIHKKYKYNNLDINIPNSDAMICGITIPLLNISFLSFYKTVQNKLAYNEFIHMLDQIPTPFILGGDFNAHHKLLVVAELIIRKI